MVLNILSVMVILNFCIEKLTNHKRQLTTLFVNKSNCQLRICQLSTDTFKLATKKLMTKD